MNWQIIIASDLFSDCLRITDLLNFFILNILYRHAASFQN